MSESINVRGILSIIIRHYLPSMAVFWALGIGYCTYQVGTDYLLSFATLSKSVYSALMGLVVGFGSHMGINMRNQRRKEITDPLQTLETLGFKQTDNTWTSLYSGYHFKTWHEEKRYLRFQYVFRVDVKAMNYDQITTLKRTVGFWVHIDLGANCVTFNRPATYSKALNHRQFAAILDTIVSRLEHLGIEPA